MIERKLSQAINHVAMKILSKCHQNYMIQGVVVCGLKISKNVQKFWIANYQPRPNIINFFVAESNAILRCSMLRDNWPEKLLVYQMYSGGHFESKMCQKYLQFFSYLLNAEILIFATNFKDNGIMPKILKLLKIDEKFEVHT